MSHVVECETEITDLESLDEAAKDLGGTLVRGQQQYEWYGRWVGDSPMPEGMTQADLGKCDHAIKFPDCSYEVGVVQKPNGAFGLRYDYWGSGGLERKLGGQKGEKLVQHYGLARAKKAARRLKKKHQQVVMADGSIKLIVEH